MLNEFSSKYDNIINVIMHHQPFPSFGEARSMLMLEEDRLTRGKRTTLAHDTSSSSDKALPLTKSLLLKFQTMRRRTTLLNNSKANDSTRVGVNEETIIEVGDAITTTHDPNFNSGTPHYGPMVMRCGLSSKLLLGCTNRNNSFNKDC